MPPKLLVAVLTIAVFSSAAGNALKLNTEESDSNKNTVNLREARSRTTNYVDIIRCAGQLDFGCVLDKSEDVLLESHNRFLVEADSQAVARKAGTEDETPSVLIDSISSIFSEISDLFKGGFTGIFRDAKDDDSEESEEVEEVEEDDDDDEDTKEKSRGINGVGRIKKKKKKKLKAIIKLLVLGVVLFGKITLLLKVLAAHLQIKFLAIAFAGLVLNAARFYLDLKKGHTPQKVIYYEHAQHQHHYDGAEDEGWSGGGGGGSHGGYWGRSYDLAEDKKTAQDVAYAQSKPSGTAYTRVDDKPNFSWL